MDRSVSYSEFRIEIKLRLRFVSQPPHLQTFGFFHRFKLC
jgi:hypothetical protein